MSESDREVQLPDDAVPIDLKALRDEESESWERASNAEPDVRQGDRDDLFIVQMDDSDDAHNLSLVEVRDGPWLGWCSCKGFEFHNHCAHICRIAQMSALNNNLVPTLDEDPRDDIDADVVDHSEQEDANDGRDDQAPQEPAEPDIVDAHPHGSDDTTTVETPTVDEIDSMPLDDPLEVLPGWMKTPVERHGGDVDLNKRGCQVVVSALDLEVHPDPVERAADTEHDRAVYRATVVRPDGREFEAEAEAHVEESNVKKWDLNRMAETRAKKRAVKWATGGGLLAMFADDGPDIEDDHVEATTEQRARADGGFESVD
jgi:hypothetical protein